SGCSDRGGRALAPRAQSMMQAGSSRSTPPTGDSAMSTTSTASVQTNRGHASIHLKPAARDAGDAVRSAASAAGDELKLGRANVKGDLADSALSGLGALEDLGEAGREQLDHVLDKSRDLVDSAADLSRERPLASFGVAFAAGWIIAKLARGSR